MRDGARTLMLCDDEVCFGQKHKGGVRMRFVFSILILATMAWVPVVQATVLGELAQNGDLAGVKAAIAAGADVNAINRYGDTPTDIAAREGHDKIVKLLLAKDAKIYDKNDMLRAAIRGGMLWLVKNMLKKGANVNAADQYGQTPLYLAAFHGHTDVAKLLLAKDANIRDKSKMLRAASYGGLLWLVKDMLAKGADVNTKRKYGGTPLSNAVDGGHADVIKLLLAHGADVNTSGSLDQAPLYSAAWRGQVEVMKLLLAHGADVNAGDEYGQTPLHKASGNKYGDTPFHTDLPEGQADVIKLLLAHGANINIKDKYGKTPLSIASDKGHVEVVKLLLAHGADVNTKNKYGDTPIDNAAIEGHDKIVKLLLAHGARIADRDDMLGKASHGGMLWLVKDMIDKGVHDDAKESALREAASDGFGDIARLLLAHGTPINDKVDMLYAASYGGLLWLVKDMLNNGVDINASLGGGKYTALHSAASGGKIKVVDFLLKHGTIVNAKNGDGETPLSKAADGGYTNIVKLLLAHGADVNIKSKDFVGTKTILAKAASKGHADVVKLLLAHGANPAGAYDRAKTDAIRQILADVIPKVRLFKQSLTSTNRESFRKTIKQAGGKPLREDGRYWYDKYNSSSLLSGTDVLHAGYVSKTGTLAIIEYRFPTHMDAHKIVEVKGMLVSKYGRQDASSGNPDLGKASFTWDRGPVKIVVKRDWPDTTVFLDYIVKDAKKAMDTEIAENDRRKKQKKLKAQANAF